MIAATLATPAAATPDLTIYARALAADIDNRPVVAARGYARALAATPDNPVVARRAYRAALEAGDDALLLQALATLDRAGTTPPDGALIALTEAIRTRDKPAQAAALTRIDGGSFDFLSAPLAAWLAIGTGADPVAILDAGKRNALTVRIDAENRALLLIATGRIDEGAAALQALLATSSAALDLRINAAQLLAGQGRHDVAQALLPGDDRVMVAFRSRLGGGVKPSPAFGISRLLARIVADLVQGDETAMPFSIALSRAALRLDPANHRARLLLADALSRGGAIDAALATLGEIPPDSPFYPVARDARVTVLARAEDPAASLDAARLLSAAMGASSAAAARYGALLHSAGRHADAARAFETAIARAGDQAGWSLYLQLGGALDEAGRWPEARKALKTALALAPSEPLALNYLGYAMLSRGEDMPAARAMLERAAALAPGNASVTDSLGFAYLRAGDATRALPLLERAARAEPANGEIAEHLGDAYWAAGRRYEARYAWRAASIVANGSDGTRLAGKIASGL